MKFYSDNFCCHKFNARFFQNELFLPLRKDILRRIWPIKLKFFRICCSEYVLLDERTTFPYIAFCRSYALKRMLDFLYQIQLVIISCVYNFSQISMLITVSFLSSLESCKKDSF